MTKNDIIRWLKAERGRVIEAQKDEHRKALAAYRTRFVETRITPMELDLLRDEARRLLQTHKDIMSALTTNGPNPAWNTAVGDIKMILDYDNLFDYFVYRLQFDSYPDYAKLETKLVEARRATLAQWDQLLEQAKALSTAELRELLDDLSLTPVEPPAVTAPALPAIPFNREVLMGCLK